MRRILWILAFILALYLLGTLFGLFNNRGAVVVEKKLIVGSVIPENNIAPARILFVGDISFDRHIRKIVNQKGSDYIFSCLDGLLQKADLVVGNLESPITLNQSVSMGSVVDSPENYRFTSPTTTAEVLYKQNIKLVNIGNNHIGDFGLSGITSTRDYLENAGVSYFGGLADNSNIHSQVIDNQNLVFINYNQFGGDSYENVARLISQEKLKNSIVIVYAHWGEEYVQPTETVRSIAKFFSESGADLVMGSHPHVIQEKEIIGNTIVYYSLGNFIFDQYWMEPVRKGLVVAVEIDNGKITTGETVVSIYTDGRTCLK
jgi:poly-gamma-glutamate synthesis protein (capsule biosynthesis protein)